MKTNHGRDKLWFFLMGIVAACAILFLTGANGGGHVGRYQISTCLKRDWVYVYVIDTTTGVVKFVNEKDERKAFEEIK